MVRIVQLLQLVHVLWTVPRSIQWRVKEFLRTKKYIFMKIIILQKLTTQKEADKVRDEESSTTILVPILNENCIYFSDSSLP